MGGERAEIQPDSTRRLAVVEPVTPLPRHRLRRSGLTGLLILALAAEIGMLSLLLSNRDRPESASPMPQIVSALERPRPVAPASPPAAKEPRPHASKAAAASHPVVDPPVPHPMPEQLRAARRIAEVRAEERRREASAAALAARPAPLAPPGRVIQLGTYASKDDATKAADTFRYRYRGLLQSLPQGIVAYRPAGATQPFYRVQFVMPSQAYAEVTCQRLRAANKKCTVIY